MLIRQRKLKVSGMHTQEEIVSINKRYEKRETKREAKALIAAKLETAIEKELLSRLQKGTYKDIYNLEQTEFEQALDEEEVGEHFEGQVSSEEEDDQSYGSDFDDLSEEGEDELEEDIISESEMDRLEAQEKRDKEDLEEQGRKSTKSSDHPSKAVKKDNKKRPRPSVELNYEYEEEVEKAKVPKKRVRNDKTVDF